MATLAGAELIFYPTAIGYMTDYTSKDGDWHDAAEVYTVDIRTPLKKWKELKALTDLEDRISNVIAQRFGLDSLHSSAVKRADTYVRAQEMRDFMAKPNRKCSLIKN
jgi:hypothetical protein